MLFLLEYDRRAGQLVKLERFAQSETSAANRARLDLELELNKRRIEHEVVLLEANSEEALQRTHRRYFAKITELAPARRVSEP
jgi:hypothetical protein